MNNLAPWTMLGKANDGICDICATAHEPSQPHNAQSMFYKYSFYDKHGVWPTWADAIAHCDKKTKDHWKKELTRLGQRIGRKTRSDAGSRK